YRESSSRTSAIVSVAKACGGVGLESCAIIMCGQLLRLIRQYRGGTSVWQPLEEPRMFSAAHTSSSPPFTTSPIHHLMTPPTSSPAARDVTFYRWEDMPREKVSDMLDRRLIT